MRVFVFGLGTCAFDRCEVLCSGCPEDNILQVLDDLVGKAGLSVVSGCTMVRLGTCVFSDARFCLLAALRAASSRCWMIWWARLA
jgi:hypothetical protein